MAELTVVVSMLKQLSLTEASAGLESVISKAALANQTPLDVLEELLHLEIDGRNKRGKAKRLKAACLPYVEGLDNFDFERKGFKGISKAHIRQLTELTWLEKAYNIMFLGPTGLGKTRLSVGLGLKAIEAGYNVAFVSLDELMRLLKTSEISTRAARRVRAITKSDLVLLDEVGFLPISSSRTQTNYTNL